MSVKHIHTLCCQYKGRSVKIATHDGGVHRGVIQDVNPHRVFIRPHCREGLGGFGYGFYGPSYGYGSGFGYGIALGSIATIALLPFFF